MDVDELRLALSGADLSSRRLDKRAAVRALAAARRLPVVWADGMAHGLRLTTGATTARRQFRDADGGLDGGSGGVEFVGIDRAIVRAARQEVAKAAPVAER